MAIEPAVPCEQLIGVCDSVGADQEVSDHTLSFAPGLAVHPPEAIERIPAGTWKRVDMGG